MAERKIIVWGAASKGVIFSLLLHRTGATIDKIVDINPRKQGRFIPATGLQVSTPESLMESCDVGSMVYVMNSNYLEEVRGLTKNKLNCVTLDEIEL